MATTTNFGWTTPDDTALVKDGASAIRSLGSSIDTSMAQLKGGTTGQILSKTSNSDMAFTWIANDQGDITAVTTAANSGLTGGATSGAVALSLATVAKGDLLVGTGTGTASVLTAGANDTTLIADSTTATGLKWGTPASGGMTLLSTTTLSGSSTTVSSISQNYNMLYVVISGVNMSQTVNLVIEPNGNALPAQKAYFTSGATGGGTGIYSETITSGNTNNAFIFRLHNYTDSSYYKPIEYFGSADFDSSKTFYMAGIYKTNTSAITSLKFTGSAAMTFSAGQVKIYGVK